ncbi:MAG: hypothetical protein M1818_004794 [Claussenomyces sp. TS43310]|nr:MAG: hypothetical protein M1818_004794 [Claussenomyces sp. TS43310]
MSTRTCLVSEKLHFDVATDGILEKLLEFMSEYNVSEFSGDLGHFKLKLPVLKLGAGHGARTTKILQGCEIKTGQHLFSRYVLADASTLIPMLEKLGSNGFTIPECACLNIERDLVDQVLADEAFLRMTVEDWNTAVEPKVNGTWRTLEITK